MKRGTLSLRSLRYYWRTQLSVWAGLSVSAMVLTGGLIVGDSVRYTLNRISAERIGEARYALSGGDRFFRGGLADRLGESLAAPVAPVLLLQGTIANADGSARVHRSQVVGVDHRFWSMALTPAPPSPPVAENQVWVNRRLAARLDLQVGEEVVVRAGRPGDLPRDAPLSTEADQTVGFRRTVGGIIPDAAYGRFALQANQVEPPSLFLPLAALQQRVELRDQINVILVGARDEPEPPEGESASAEITVEELDEVVRRVWTLEDAGLELRRVPDRDQWELRTRRVFLDPPVAAAARSLTGPGADGSAVRPLPAITYLANDLTSSAGSTPYALVAALPVDQWPGWPGPTPPPWIRMIWWSTGGWRTTSMWGWGTGSG